MKVTMPYFSALSVNSMYVIGRGGRRTYKIKPAVTEWMEELGDKVRGFDVRPPIQVSLTGKFRDGRHPDLSNLHKVLCDGLKLGLTFDDKDYLVEDMGWEEYCDPQELEIEICQG